MFSSHCFFCFLSAIELKRISLNRVIAVTDTSSSEAARQPKEPKSKNKGKNKGENKKKEKDKEYIKEKDKEKGKGKEKARDGKDKSKDKDKDKDKDRAKKNKKANQKEAKGDKTAKAAKSQVVKLKSRNGDENIKKHNKGDLFNMVHLILSDATSIRNMEAIF